MTAGQLSGHVPFVKNAAGVEPPDLRTLQKFCSPLSFLKHVNGGLIFVNSPILKFVNGAQKPHLRCADSLPTIRFPAVYLPFLKNQWKITWISRSVCE